MATVLKSNPDLEVDVRTNMGTESYSGSSNPRPVNSWSGDETRSDMDKKATDKKKTDKTAEKNTDVSVQTEARANIGDSGFVGSGTVTKSTTPQDDKTKKSTTNKTTVKTKSTPEQKSSTMNTRVSGSTKSSTAGKFKSENWNLHNARLNTIASELSNNGVGSVHVMTASGNRMVSNSSSYQSGMTSSSTEVATTAGTTANASRGYQIVVSSSNDNWYDMMNENDKKASGTGSTPINSNKSTGSVAETK